VLGRALKGNICVSMGHVYQYPENGLDRSSDSFKNGSVHANAAGLPDFSWCNLPKLGKYAKLPRNIPNVRLKYQMAAN
jgi:hypothetical protein